MTSPVPNIQLNSGTTIPQLGFGVFRVTQEQTQGVVEKALEVGFRHIDTATGYDNEAQVGAAIRALGIDRKEIFVTTKLRNDHNAARDVEGAFNRSVEALGLDYVDLYLIHWPMPALGFAVDNWERFQDFKASGLAKAIGVSNFRIEDLKAIIKATGVAPAVNQVETHPIFQQRELRAFHEAFDIKIEAWAPLGQGRFVFSSLEPVRIAAEKYGKSFAQIILRWHLQEGIIPLPKSLTPSRIEENFNIFDFELDDNEVALINALDTNQRLAHNPSLVNHN
ncbi:MAG: aldo/keto reductase [Propionibacteriaceae bacterium]|jgi:2,5-diketo-D-gluconate reductase A|nr:aldo/keto reductase [Propionibacteriaceae bacterium]